MSTVPQILPDDPALLKALIAALQAENAKISATLRAHDQLIQALRLRIARLKKQVFGQSSEKIEQLELALEDLLIATAESETSVPADGQGDDTLETSATDGVSDRPSRRRPRVSDSTPRERQELDPGRCCPDCGGELCQYSGVDLVGLHPCMGDGLHLQRVRDDDPRHERCQKSDDGRGIAGRFQNDLVI